RLSVLRAVERHVAKGARGREHELPSGAEHTGALGYRPHRVGERHRSPIAEDEVEHAIPQRKLFCAGAYQGEADLGLPLELSGPRELDRRKVDARRPGPSASQRNRPAGRAATEFQDGFPARIPKKTQFTLRYPEQPPRGGGCSPQYTGVTTVVPPAYPVPDSAVVANVPGRTRRPTPRALTFSLAIHPEHTTRTFRITLAAVVPCLPTPGGRRGPEFLANPTHRNS